MLRFQHRWREDFDPVMKMFKSGGKLDGSRAVTVPAELKECSMDAAPARIYNSMLFSTGNAVENLHLFTKLPECNKTFRDTLVTFLKDKSKM